MSSDHFTIQCDDVALASGDVPIWCSVKSMQTPFSILNIPRKLEKDLFLPTKQMPILSFRFAVGSSSCSAIARSLVLVRHPIGNKTCTQDFLR